MQNALEVNLNWTPRTLSGVYYEFGKGNPKETDKTIEELIEMSKACFQQNEQEAKCKNIDNRYEKVGGFRNSQGIIELSGKPKRMTPEIEKLVYEFLSHSVIRQSSESC